MYQAQQQPQQFQAYPQQMLPFPPMQMPMVINQTQKNTSLYLGDLEEQVDDQMILQRFKQFGHIQGLKIFRSQRKNRAHALLTYATEQQAEKAKDEMNHEKLLTREIRVLWYKPGVKPNAEANLFIKGVPVGVTSKALEKQLAEKFGTVESLRLSENNYGYVQFEKKESAEQCLKRTKEISDDFICEEYLAKGERIDVRRNLYMKNIKQGNADEIKEELKKMLSEFGEITSILVKSTKIQDQDKLFAFVCFDTYDTAKKVMEAWSNKDIFGSGEPIYVSWAETKAQRIKKLRDLYLKQGNDTIIFTKNVKITTTNEQLQLVYEKHGKVIRCVIKEPKKIEGKNYKPTKFGYIYFENKDDAKKAQQNIVKDEEAKELYEDQVYVNFLLNKEAYEKYKKKQQNNTKNDDTTNPMNNMPQQFQQFLMQFMNMMMNMNAKPGHQGMPMMGGHPPNRPNRQMGHRQETNRQFRQNQQNYQSRKQDYQQPPMHMMPQQMMPQNQMIPNQMPEQGMMPQQRPPMGMPPMGMPPMGMPPMGMPPMGMPQQMPMQPQQMGMPQQMPMQMPQNKPQMPQQPQFQQPQFQPEQQQQPQPQQVPQQQIQFKSVQELKGNLNHFLSLSQLEQRKILGEMLFPKVNQIVTDEVQAPKITGMLIDFEVFEVQDILELLENEESLKEQIKEAIELIKTQSQ